MTLHLETSILIFLPDFLLILTPDYVTMDGDQINSLENLNLFSPGRRLPPISPDEAVIRSRGKRKVPVRFSPEKDEEEVAASPSTPRSVKKICMVSSGKGGWPAFLRVTPKPRKLFVDDNGPVEISAKKVKDEDNTDSDPDSLNVTSAMKFRTEEMNHNNNIGKTEDPLKVVKVLSQDQLVKVLTDLAEEDISTKLRMTELLPVEPDISRKITKLKEMRLNVYKALPRSRLTNHHDSLR